MGHQSQFGPQSDICLSAWSECMLLDEAYDHRRQDEKNPDSREHDVQTAKNFQSGLGGCLLAITTPLCGSGTAPVGMEKLE